MIWLVLVVNLGSFLLLLCPGMAPAFFRWGSFFLVESCLLGKIPYICGMEENTQALIEKAQSLLERIPGVGFHGFLGQRLVYWHQDEHDEVQTYSVPFSDLPNFVAQCEKAAA